MKDINIIYLLTDNINFKKIFYVTQHIQNVIISICNHNKTYYWDILHYFVFFWHKNLQNLAWFHTYILIEISLISSTLGLRGERHYFK